MHAACVIAPNFVPHARVLAASFRRHHARGRLSVLVVDDDDLGSRVEIAGAEVLTPADIGIDERELHLRAVLFDAQGVISSLRPVLLAHVLRRGAEAVLLLDADMLVLAPFDDVWRLARDSGVLLSPHALTPLPGGPGAWREEELLRSGTFSGGFLGVGATGVTFLDWLTARAARDCLRAPERGLLYTQTWLNLVPALFAHHVLRDAGINAQVHALAGQDVTFDDAGPRLGRAPLRLYHFAGFDPGDPARLCRYYDRDIGLDSRPGLRRLCGEYAALLHQAGWPMRDRWRWDTTTAGLTIDAAVRRAYREGVLIAECGEGPQPPDPFDPGENDSTIVWLRTPPARVETTVSRYLLALLAERADLRSVFPDVPGRDDHAYLRWAAEKVQDGCDDHAEIPAILATAAPG
ncbi:MAG: hypothetical protein ACR2LK_06585 [Solirubrobacteraceae bacterium]